MHILFVLVFCLVFCAWKYVDVPQDFDIILYHFGLKRILYLRLYTVQQSWDRLFGSYRIIGILRLFRSRCLLYSPVTADDQATVPTQEQLSVVFHKDLVMNVFRDGKFGSFRHLPLLSGCLSS